jgi:hypothetical protein
MCGQTAVSCAASGWWLVRNFLYLCASVDQRSSDSCSVLKSAGDRPVLPHRIPALEISVESAWCLSSNRGGAFFPKSFTCPVRYAAICPVWRRWHVVAATLLLYFVMTPSRPVHALHDTTTKPTKIWTFAASKSIWVTAVLCRWHHVVW